MNKGIDAVIMKPVQLDKFITLHYWPARLLMGDDC